MSIYIFLVHVEESFRKNFGLNLIKNIKQTIYRYPYAKVIHFTSYIDNDCPIQEIKPFVHQEIDWAWGYDYDCFSNQYHEQQYVIPCNDHSVHPFTWIPPELRNWNKNDFIILGGGCENECLGGMVAILEYLKAPYRKNKGICY